MVVPGGAVPVGVAAPGGAGGGRGPSARGPRARDHGPGGPPRPDGSRGPGGCRRPPGPADDLDPAARRWVEETLDGLSVDGKVGQLVTPTFRSSLHEQRQRRLRRPPGAGAGAPRRRRARVRRAASARPDVLLNPTYSRTTLGQPLAAASLLNRLQAAAEIPLLVTADFETGVGFRMAGRHQLPPRDGLRRRGRSPPGLRGRPHHRGRGAGHRCPRELRPGGRRQQQPPQPGDQHTVVRRGPDHGWPAGRGVRRGVGGGRHDRRRQALSGARRHGRRLAPRAAGHPPPPRATRCSRVPPVSRRHRGRGGRRDDGARCTAGARPGRCATRRRSARRLRLRCCATISDSTVWSSPTRCGCAPSPACCRPADGGGAGGGRRARRRPAFAGRPGRPRRRRCGGGGRHDRQGAARPVGAARAGGEGAARPAPRRPCRPRRAAGDRRHSSASRGGPRGERAIHHPDQGRGRGRTVAYAARRQPALPVDPRLSRPAGASARPAGS